MTADLDATSAAILVTAGRLRDALGWLAELIPAGRTRHHPAAPGEQARARRDAAIRAERADAHLSGYGLGVDQPTPVRLGPLTAQIRAAELIREACRIAAARLGRRHTARPFGDVDQVAAALAWITDRTPDTALDWLGALVDQLDEQTLEAIRARLVDADRLARDAAGIGAERRPVHAACPACGRRSLYVDTSSDRHTGVIGCDRNACRCLGPDCGCGRYSTWPGRRHLWPYEEWRDLARRLATPATWRRATAAPCPCACHHGDACDVLGGCATIGCHDGTLAGAA